MREPDTTLIRDGEFETVVKATLRIITSALVASTAHLAQEDRCEVRRLMIEEKLPDFFDMEKRAAAQRRTGSLTSSELVHVNNATGYFCMLLDDTEAQAVWGGVDTLRDDNS
ncbi:MAG: hypothetical protein F4Y88_01390 [Chloroflexi bacterium]|nr:hypothetical protein [Chloroflexota bacterium]